MEAVKKACDVGHLLTAADRSKNKGSMSPFLPTCASYEPCIWIRVVSSSYIYQLIFAQNWEKPICASLLLSCIILDHHHNVAPILCINGINPCIWVLSNCCWAACSFYSKKWFGSSRYRSLTTLSAPRGFSYHIGAAKRFFWNNKVWPQLLSCLP